MRQEVTQEYEKGGEGKECGHEQQAQACRGDPSSLVRAVLDDVMRERTALT